MNDPTRDNAIFDRLADGELAPDERRTLLASLDEREDGWRRCALAFLEAQAWKQEFRELVRTSEVMSPVTTTAEQRRVFPRASGWLVVAAGLLVACGLGWVLVQGVVVDRPSALPANDMIAVAPPAAPPTSPTFDEDSMTMWVRDAQGRATPLEVPLVDADALDRQYGVQFRSGIPDEVRRRAAEQGYQVQTRRRYAPLWLEQGQPLMVPVEDTQIVPVSRTVY